MAAGNREKSPKGLRGGLRITGKSRESEKDRSLRKYPVLKGLFIIIPRKPNF